MNIPENYRKLIFNRYNWIQYEYIKEQPMILHSDFDGIMSGMFLHEIHGCYPIGFYDLKCIWIGAEYYSNDFEKLRETLYLSIWVDVDIYRKEIRSIGHHILKFTKRDQIPEHVNSLNPNLIRGVYRGNFQRKYPFGTIHFLMMIYEYTLNTINPQLEALLWHPDSSLANAQHYSSNAQDWLQNFLGLGFMIQALPKINTVNFENNLKNIHDELIKIGFPQGRSQIKTIHLGLKGYQCSFNDPNSIVTKLENLIKFISKITSWKQMKIPSYYIGICGHRITKTYREIRVEYGSFDNFLSIEKPFSYAIHERDRLSFTKIPRI